MKALPSKAQPLSPPGLKVLTVSSSAKPQCSVTPTPSSPCPKEITGLATAPASSLPEPIGPLKQITVAPSRSAGPPMAAATPLVGLTTF